jgi:hypothetical protein
LEGETPLRQQRDLERRRCSAEGEATQSWKARQWTTTAVCRVAAARLEAAAVRAASPNPSREWRLTKEKKREFVIRVSGDGKGHEEDILW